jgi:hypothetical protein
MLSTRAGDADHQILPGGPGESVPGAGAPGDESSPWAMGPDPDAANGDLLEINMTYSGAEGAVSFVAETARRHGLVCFDPQSGRVL